jgi:hypothetical protein
MSDFFNTEWPIVRSTREDRTTWTAIDSTWVALGEYGEYTLAGNDLSWKGYSRLNPFHMRDRVAELYEAIIAQQIEK